MITILFKPYKLCHSNLFIELLYHARSSIRRIPRSPYTIITHRWDQWPTLFEIGPTLIKHGVNVSCLLGIHENNHCAQWMVSFIRSHSDNYTKYHRPTYHISHDNIPKAVFSRHPRWLVRRWSIVQADIPAVHPCPWWLWHQAMSSHCMRWATRYPEKAP